MIEVPKAGKVSTVSNVSKGFTLVELLISIGIMALLFFIAPSGLRDFGRRQDLESMGRKVKGELRLAQEYALSGKKPSPPDAKCIGTNVIDGYSFRVSGTAFFVEAKCSGGNAYVTGFVDPTSVGISITAPSPNPITFKALGQGTNIASGGSAVITLTQIGTGNTLSITVTSGGEIK